MINMSIIKKHRVMYHFFCEEEEMEDKFLVSLSVSFLSNPLIPQSPSCGDDLPITVFLKTGTTFFSNERRNGLSASKLFSIPELWG